jgi:hypothetical protein
MTRSVHYPSPGSIDRGWCSSYQLLPLRGPEGAAQWSRPNSESEWYVALQCSRCVQPISSTIGRHCRTLRYESREQLGNQRDKEEMLQFSLQSIHQWYQRHDVQQCGVYLAAYCLGFHQTRSNLRQTKWRNSPNLATWEASEYWERRWLERQIQCSLVELGR